MINPFDDNFFEGKSLETEFLHYTYLMKFSENAERYMQIEVSSALRSVSAGLNIVQKINDLAGKTKNAELIEAIAELKLEMAKAKLSLADAITESIDLQKEIEELKQKLEQKDLLTLKGSLYYKEGDKIPFCPKCYENDNKALHLAPTHKTISMHIGKYQCKTCGHYFQ